MPQPTKPNTDFKAASLPPMTQIHYLRRKNKKFQKLFLAPYSIALTMMASSVAYSLLLSLYLSLREKLISEEFFQWESLFSVSQQDLLRAKNKYLVIVEELSSLDMLLNTMNVMIGGMFAEEDMPDFANEILNTQTSLLQSKSESDATSKIEKLQASAFLETLEQLTKEKTFEKTRSSFFLGFRYLTTYYTSHFNVIDFKNNIIYIIGEIKAASLEQFCSDALNQLFTRPSQFIDIVGNSKTHLSVPHPDIFKKSFRELFGLLLDARKAHVQTSSFLAGNSFLQFFSAKQQQVIQAASDSADKWQFLSISLMAMISRFMIFEPLLLGIYNRWFTQKLPFNLRSNNLTELQAQANIEALEKRNTVLLNQAKKNILYARCISALCAMYLMYCGLSNTAVPTHFFIFTLCSVLTGLNFAEKDYFSWSSKRSVKKALREKYSLYKKALPENIRIAPYAHKEEEEITDLEDYSFIVSVLKVETVKAENMSKIIQKALLRNQIDASLNGSKGLSIAAESVIDLQKVGKISEHIRRNIDRENSIEKLKGQLSKLNALMSRVNPFSHVPDFNQNDDRINRFEFIIPDVYRGLFIAERLALIFCSCKIILEEGSSTNAYHDCFFLSISGSQEGDSEALSALFSDIAQVKASLESKEVTSSWPEVSLGKIAFKQKKSASSSSSTTEAPMPIPSVPLSTLPPRILIHWDSATYDSYGKCPVVQIQKNPPIYAYLALSLADFVSLGLGLRCFIRVSSKIDRRKIVSPVGYEGIVRIPEADRPALRALYGTFFDPVAKVKLLGEFNHVRISADEEESETKEKLWVFKHIAPDAH